MKKNIFIFTGLISIILSSSFAKDNKSIKEIYFENLDLPKTDEEIKMVKISPKFTIKYNDGSTKEYPLSYEVIAKTGDKIGNGEFGMFYDINLQPILADDGSKTYSNMPDANSLIKINNINYLITHFEEPPGLLYKTELDNNGKAIKTEPIDFKDVGGTIINCAGSLTPWNTHLGGEEDYDLNPRYADKNSPYYTD
ncbi:protein of unknown function, partial [Venenivibrio stagnispumantis]